MNETVIILHVWKMEVYLLHILGKATDQILHTEFSSPMAEKQFPLWSNTIDCDMMHICCVSIQGPHPLKDPFKDAVYGDVPFVDRGEGEGRTEPRPLLNKIKT